MTPELALVDALPNIRSMSKRAAFRFSLDADDLVQYTAERVLKQLRNVRSADNLVAVAVSRASMVLKTGIKREAKHVYDPVDEDLPAPRREIDTMAVLALAQIAADLPARQRDIYECVYQQDMTLAEYCRMRGLHQRTVWEAHESLLGRMRAALGVEAPEKAGQGVKDDAAHVFLSPEGEQVSMTRHEFMDRVGVVSGDVSNLLSRKRKSCKGWRLA